MSVRLLFFSLVCFFSTTSAVFAIHTGEKHKEELPNNLQQVPDGPPSVKPDNSSMIRIPVGTFKMGSSFVENKSHLKQCRKYDRSCELWWFRDEY
ncbi:MAG: formylglycine-generating enzyme family protein, partial [Nitrospina sp.]|nr:formylglycine-generating enzyme family protein [Nitrospina sp.]